MSSKRNSGGSGNNKMYQASLFQYTKSRPRKSTPAASTLKEETASSSKSRTSFTSTPPFYVTTDAVSPPTSQASASGAWTSSGASREVKENFAPNTPVMNKSQNTAHSSPIHGLNVSWDQVVTEEEAHAGSTLVLDRERSQVKKGVIHAVPKRKAREWTLDEPVDSMGTDRSKRRRKSSGASFHGRSGETSSPRASEARHSTDNRRPLPHPQNQQSQSLTKEIERDAVVDEESGTIIESSQTQPLLTPERPRHSIDRFSSFAPSPGLVRSSQSPSPLKLSTSMRTVDNMATARTSSPLKNSTPQSPLKETTPMPCPPVKKRRRVPETVSLLSGKVTVGEILAQNSLQNSSLKRIRRPGRYSAVSSTNEPQTPVSNTEVLPSDLPRSSLRPPSSPLHVNQSIAGTPPETSPSEANDGTIRKNQHGDQGPFWETQPLLDIDSDWSPPNSPSQPPSSLPRMPLSTCSPTSRAPEPRSSSQKADDRIEHANTPGSETEPDSPDVAIISPRRLINISADPDRTFVASNPRKPKVFGLKEGDFVMATALAVNTSPLTNEGVDERDVDGDKTMVNHHHRDIIRSVANGKSTDTDIKVVTRSLEGLSPFKRVEKRAHFTVQASRIHDVEDIVIDDDNDPATPHLKEKTNLYALFAEEETQGEPSYTQAWPGTSLPTGWDSIFETPMKPGQVKGTASKYITGRHSLPSHADQEDWHEDSDWDDHASDDGFGLELTPRTAQHEKPDVVRAFEAQPSPFSGMFSGSIDGESESETEG